MTNPDSAWADTTCLLCGPPPEVGHHPGCQGTDPPPAGAAQQLAPPTTCQPDGHHRIYGGRR